MVNDPFASFEDDLTAWGEDEDLLPPKQDVIVADLSEDNRIVAPPVFEPAVSDLEEFIYEKPETVSNVNSVEEEPVEEEEPIVHPHRGAVLNRLNTGRWVADFSMACASIGATVAFTGIPPVTAIWVWFAGAIINSPNYVPLVAALPYFIVTIVPVLLGVIALVTSFSYSAKERSNKFRKTLRWMSIFSISAGALLMFLVLSGAFPVLASAT